MTTEETKTVRLYDKEGKLTRERRIVSELVVYQPPRDATKTTEYRNVLEVDGKLVSERQERLEKVFERAAKSNSVDKELDRIRRDGTRYDFGYHLTGYTIYKGIALWKGARQSFKFEVEETEQIDNFDCIVLRFNQIEPRTDLFQIDLPSELKPSDARISGRIWLDRATGQLRREQHEINFRSQLTAERLPRIRTEYDFAPSAFGLWLPQRIVLDSFNPLKIEKNKAPVMYRAVRYTSGFGQFKRFNVAVQEASTSSAKPQQ